RVLAFHDVQRRLGGAHRDGAAAECRDRESGEGVRDFFRRDGRADGESVRDALGEGHDVGLDAPVLDAAPVIAGTAPARLYFIADEDAAILADDPYSELEILLGRRDESSDTRDRLGDERGGLTRGLRANELLDVLGAANLARRIREAERTAIAVGRQRVLDPRDLRRDEAPGRVPRERLRRERATGIPVTQRNDLLLAGVQLRDEDRGLVGLGSTRREQTLLQFARRELDRKSTRLNSSHLGISYAVFCLKKKKKQINLSKRIVKTMEWNEKWSS